ncbi:hypothetical protein PspR84_04100 [Pseudomonas sp. R84]|nr:YdaS family helix-turn-helix protein [Pseudomonas sp. R84]QHC93840.1 hypothetical protein PspR84_04100 [Pseudomonas sp. R84]
MIARNKALLEWLKTAPPYAIADTQTTAGYLRRIAYGQKMASAEMASGIERATSGLVTRKELRPNDWHLVWPELAERSPTMEQIVAQPSVRAQSAEGAVNTSSGVSR